MTRRKDDNIERAIDGKQDGLQGNRLRLFSAGGELAIRRRWFKGTMLPLATGRGAKLIGFRAGVDVEGGWPGASSSTGMATTPAPGELLPSLPALAWLECRTWAIFAHVTATWQEALGWTFAARPVYQTPPDVDPVTVLGYERALVGNVASPDVRVLAQYEAWLAGRAPAWSRASWVQERLAEALTPAGG